MTQRTLARTVRFTPYRRCMGPSFTLRMYWTGLTDTAGRNRIGYRLVSEGRVLFEGDDYAAHNDPDQNQAVEGIMGFLCCRPGDTDAEYFRNYTADQLAFCDQHAEALGCEMGNRFQCHECGAGIDDDGACYSHGKARRTA